MANSLIRSNRNNDEFKPKKMAKPSDFENDKFRSTNQVTSVTFDTNLKISNHSRNKLQAMSNLGYADNQRLSLDVSLESFYESLTNEEQKEFELQLKILEKRDVKLRNKD